MAGAAVAAAVMAAPSNWTAYGVEARTCLGVYDQCHEIGPVVWDVDRIVLSASSPVLAHEKPKLLECGLDCIEYDMAVQYQLYETMRTTSFPRLSDVLLIR